jgi:hypothetical protein
MKKIHWEEAEEDTMAYLFSIGKSDDEIGVILNREANSIRAKRQKLGLRVHPRRVQIELSKETTLPISKPKHADNLPDVGDSLVAIINEIELLRGLMTDILHVNQSTMKDVDALVTITGAQYELFKRIDGNRVDSGKPQRETNDTKGRSPET